MPQPKRTETLERFKNGEIRLLVASDVAARGLDIQGLSHVFNFDVPHHAEDYVHRIGRTGRAGRQGRAFTLAAPEDGKFGRGDREADRQGRSRSSTVPDLRPPNSTPRTAGPAGAAGPSGRARRDASRSRGSRGRDAVRVRDRPRREPRAEPCSPSPPRLSGTMSRFSSARRTNRRRAAPQSSPGRRAARRRFWRPSAGFSRATLEDRRSRLILSCREPALR